jgi:hypothetical protein
VIQLIAPFAALTVLEPEYAGSRVGRVMLDKIRKRHFALIGANVDIWMRIANGPMIERMLNTIVSLFLSKL